MRVRVRDLAPCILTVRKRHCDARDRCEESGNGHLVKCNSNIYYNFPVLAYVFSCRDLRMVRVCGERSISRRIISAQFRRSVYIIRVRCGSQPYKSSCLFLCILAMAISFLEHAEIAV